MAFVAPARIAIFAVMRECGWMKELISGVSVIRSNTTSKFKNRGTPFRYFPRAGFDGTVFGDGEFGFYFPWTKKNGAHLVYLYRVGTVAEANVIVDQIQLTDVLPGLAGGYLFNYGWRARLDSVIVL